MTTSVHRESAKIYQFPVRVHATAGGRRDEGKPVANLTSPRVAKAVFGSGWYHDAAIQDAEQPNERQGAPFAS